MTRLEIRLSGTFEVRRGQEQVTDFASAKVRALLAYLAVESDRPHLREAIAALLWPESSQEAALSSLRNALANLRQVIADAGTSMPPGVITLPSIPSSLTDLGRYGCAESRRCDAPSRPDQLP